MKLIKYNKTEGWPENFHIFEILLFRLSIPVITKKDTRSFIAIGIILIVALLTIYFLFS